MKWQEVRETRGSAYAALLYAVLTTIEETAETEEALWGSRVPGLLLDPVSALSEVRLSSRIEVYVPGTSGSRVVEVGGTAVTLRFVEPRSGYVGVDALYSTAYRATLMLDRDLVARLAGETTETGVEYMLLYAEDGSVLVLEGERYRVRIPRVKVVMAYHTHPEGHCGLSAKDVESALDLLTEGGLASGSATPTCAAVLYRHGLVDEDEYVALRGGKQVEGRTIRAAYLRL